MKKQCGVKLFNGANCTNEPINNNYCYWHSDIKKDDSTVKNLVPGFSTLIDAVETGGFVLEKVSFAGADLSYFNLSGLNLKGSVFHNTKMHNTLFIGADLTSTFFRESDMSDSDFTRTRLTKAGFTRCIIRNACFVNALLNLVKFNDCDLSFSDLSGVDLSNAKLYFVDLYKAVLDKVTFSNYESQIKFCNLTDEDTTSYFLQKALDWTNQNNQDVLKIIEFYKEKLPVHEFNIWIESLIVQLKQNIQRKLENYDESAVNQMLTFLKIYQMTGDTTIKKLPISDMYSDKNNPKEHLLSIKAVLNDSRISPKTFKKLTADIEGILTAYARLVPDKKKQAEDRIIKISLNSPLEILIYSASSGLIVKGIMLVIDAIKKIQEIILNKKEMKKKELETILLSLELKDKLMEQHKNADANDIDNVIKKTTAHVKYIKNNKEITEYTVSDKEHKETIKAPVKYIESANKNEPVLSNKKIKNKKRGKAPSNRTAVKKQKAKEQFSQKY